MNSSGYYLGPHAQYICVYFFFVRMYVYIHICAAVRIHKCLCAPYLVSFGLLQCKGDIHCIRPFVSFVLQAVQCNLSACLHLFTVGI